MGYQRHESMVKSNSTLLKINVNHSNEIKWSNVTQHINLNHTQCIKHYFLCIFLIIWNEMNMQIRSVMQEYWVHQNIRHGNMDPQIQV